MKNLIVLLFLIINFININNATKSCISFVNIQSNITTLPCGDTLENACQTFKLAAKSCYTDNFDSVTYNVSPGTYKFDGIDPFGTIFNKNITILNQAYSIEPLTLISSVVFDLTNAANTFFNINYKSVNDVTNINVNGITFINGLQIGQPSVLVNYGSQGQFIFENCVFENVLSAASAGSSINGGAFSFLLNETSPVVPEDLPIFKLIGCYYQNTNSSGINGGLVYVDGTIGIIMTIQSCSFNNLFGSLGAVVHVFAPVTSYPANSYTSIIDSTIQDSAADRMFYVQANVIISNLTIANNNGGIGIYTTGYRSKILINNSKFINNVNTTSIYSSYATYNNITNCEFINNNYQNNSTMDVRNGAITLMSVNGLISNCTFNNNYATFGSALYVEGSQSSSISNSIIISNKGITGTIYATQSTISLGNDVQFLNNTASDGSVFECLFTDINFNGLNQTFANNIDKNDPTTNGLSCLSIAYCNLNGNVPNSFKNNKNCQGQDKGSSNDDDKHHSNLTSGQKAAIVLCVIGGIIIIIISIILILRKIKERSAYKPVGYR